MFTLELFYRFLCSSCFATIFYIGFNTHFFAKQSEEARRLRARLHRAFASPIDTNDG